MKLSHRTVLLALRVMVLFGFVVSGFVVARSAGTEPSVAVTGACPQHVKPALTFGPARWIAITRAIRAQVPRVYANLTSMGHPAWPGFQIQALVGLNQQPLGGTFRPARVRGLSRYETVGARACGRQAAHESILVFLDFPNCQLPCSVSWAYLTRTRAGWHLWTSYRV